MSRYDTPSLLRQLPLFSVLSEAEIQRVAAATAQLRVSTGARLFSRGDPCAGFHVVVQGRVKLLLETSDGAEKVMEICGPGHSFGEAVMFLQKPYFVAAEVLEPSLLLHIGKGAVMSELDNNPDFAKHMLAGLSMRLHRLVSDLEAFTMRDGTHRVAAYLLSEHGDSNSGSFEIRLPVSKGVLASRLHITREHFSRILNELSTAGLVHVQGPVIRVLDAVKLRQHVNAN
ncbi:MAG TPA: Crp/Fnr family transcriptional regulator [Burkholderiales bacterium]|nr:Crp/Fnr family transcriptional regulator [Burkholderiales bacterium]